VGMSNGSLNSSRTLRQREDSAVSKSDPRSSCGHHQLKPGNRRVSTHAGGVRLELPTSVAGRQRQAGEGRGRRKFNV
jgi:hypothetical protein